MLKLDESNSLKEKSKKLYPSLTGTFSRAATSFVEGQYPVYAERAKGSKFWDVDGNKFLDYLCGLGPITLGYSYDRVDNAAIEQLNKGVLFSLPHPIELELAETLIQTIPHAEMVKFEKSGSNAVTAAVRAARALSGNEIIAYCGSGGVWHDWQAAMVSRDGGVPSFNRELIKIFEYNDLNGLNKIFDQNKGKIACIVLEPVVFTEPNKIFLQQVRKIANENNAVLIFDEVVTGFRFDLAGAQKFFDVKADIVCFGKGMGNGFPISALTGPTEFMNIFDTLWVSSSNNMETVSMAASNATIQEMTEKKSIEKCWEIGTQLKEGWNKISQENGLDVNLVGYPIRMNLVCKDSTGMESLELKSLISQEMVQKGIFLAPLNPVYVSYSHTENDINHTLDTYSEICLRLKKQIIQNDFKHLIHGKLPKTVWTMKIPPIK